MVELEDSKDLGSFVVRRVGSNPTTRMKKSTIDTVETVIGRAFLLVSAEIRPLSNCVFAVAIVGSKQVCFGLVVILRGKIYTNLDRG